MTDAFRCDGCGEYHDRALRFVEVTMHTDAARVAEFTLDDIPTESWALAEGKQGDYCPSCGRRLLESMADLFGGASD